VVSTQSNSNWPSTFFGTLNGNGRVPAAAEALAGIAKRAQLFIAHYGQKESDRLGLGVRFIALAPRLMPDTEFGRHAVVGYSRYLGVSEQDFIQSLPSPTTPSDVAAAVVDLAISPDRYKGRVFVVSAKGLEAVAA
jgi:hypothetical protein